MINCDLTWSSELLTVIASVMLCCFSSRYQGYDSSPFVFTLSYSECWDYRTKTSFVFCVDLEDFSIIPEWKITGILFLFRVNLKNAVHLLLSRCFSSEIRKIFIFHNDGKVYIYNMNNLCCDTYIYVIVHTVYARIPITDCTVAIWMVHFGSLWVQVLNFWAPHLLALSNLLGFWLCQQCFNCSWLCNLLRW